MRSCFAAVLAIALALVASAQISYQPKYKGDPAHSNAEAIAIAYMKTVTVAQTLYKKKHGEYAASLRELVGHGSFTRRMVSSDRGDYTAEFHCNGKDYSLSMVPKQFDGAHRAFYVNETGRVRAEDDRPATANSPLAKAND
jgi:hypothetical protein